MSGYDLLGNIAIVKFEREVKKNQKKKFASFLLKTHKSIKTVLEKEQKFKGRLRTQKTKFIDGDNTKEALYRENGCEFRFNVDTCYFSPRLSNDRMEVAKMIKKGEKVLVMFGGVAPYAVVLAKNSNAERIISVELNRECSKYALDNVKRNKLVGRVEIVQGDVRRVIGKGKKINEKFDRIMMARPNLKDSFLDVAFRVIKKKGIIHYHGFYDQEDVEEASILQEMIVEEAKKARKKIKILNVKRAGDIGIKKWRYRVDFMVF